MAIPFPSPEWTQAFKDAVNNNAAYKEAAKDWTHGKVAYVIEADEALGLKEDMGMVLDLHQGTCREASYVNRGLAEQAEFVIDATYDKWKEVLSGKVDPTKAMMQGKLKLSKGNLPTIVKYVIASKELVKSSLAIDTIYP